MSDKGRPYGTEYRTVYQVGNIKFVEKAIPNPDGLFETRTKGRVYVELTSQNQPKTIHYYDKENKHRKSIDLRHFHEGMSPHVHHGYYHNENDNEKGATGLSPQERKLVEYVLRAWYNRHSK